jgi:RsiW-degrading membrane proteinase PrsW (M82 family)
MSSAEWNPGMMLALAVAYFLPIICLMVFIGYENKKYLIYLLWGFLASIPVIILTWFILLPAFPADSDLSLSVFPLVEEFFKALPIIIPALIGIKSRDKDLLFYAMAAGIGFSLIENFGFVITALSNPTPGIVLGVLARSFSTSLMHGCTCGIIGYGIVLIRNFDRAALPVLLFGFYTLAVTTHAIFNLLLLDSSNDLGIIIDIIFPVVLFFFLRTCYHADVPGLF